MSSNTTYMIEKKQQQQKSCKVNKHIIHLSLLLRFFIRFDNLTSCVRIMCYIITYLGMTV